jgi:ABC-type transport system substrate-binding protein
MNTRSIWTRLLFGCLLLGLLAGCATAAQETPAPERTPIPTSMPTDTSEPAATPPPLDAAIEVTFDGNECTVAGPAELPRGEYNVILKYPSEGRVDLWMSFLQDGRTYQDLLDMQSEPGEYFQEPNWVLWDPRILRGWNESVDGEIFTFMLNKVGEHVIYVGNYSPGAIWFCAPLMITEAASQ